MRLAFVIESTTDVRLVEGLSERFDLTLVLPTSTGRSRISQEPSASPRAVIGPVSRMGFAAFLACHLLRRGKAYDCIIVQGYGLAALAANFVARATGLPVSMLVCSPAEAYYRSRQLDSRGTMRFHWHELYALNGIAWVNAKLGNRYIVLSRYLEQVVRSHGARGSIVRIPVYGVDTALFRPSQEPTEVKRRRRGLPETGALLFFSSRIAPEKDADTLLHAVRILRERGRHILVLHRSGGFLQFVEAARDIGVADLIIASDAAHPNGELYADYQACDICVQASREEGLGFSPLEALACGIPVVASAVGGLRETIRSGETGWTYPTGSAADLAATIEDVLDHPEEAARRAATGRRMVETEYARHRVFDLLKEHLRRIVEPGAGQ